MAGPAAAATTEPSVFKWKVASSPTNWAETLKITIQQSKALTKDDAEADYAPYLMVYEADKEPWEKKKLSNNKDLLAVLAIQGEFDDAGQFTVAKAIPMIEGDRRCAVEVEMAGVDGKALPLKDKDGQALARLVVPLPPIDLDDDAWRLDLSFRSSKQYERCQDRLVIQADVKSLLKGSTYDDDRFNSSGGDSNPSFIQSSSRKSYNYLFVHCMAAATEPLSDWYTFAKLKQMLTANSVGAHFIIDRAGTIHHMVRNAKACKHAGTVTAAQGNSHSIGIELAGLLDDLGPPMMLSRALVKRAQDPPATSTGALSASVKEALKAAVAFLSHEAGSSKTRFVNRTGKMIDAMASKYKDTDFTTITSLWWPDNRASWQKVVGYYGAPGPAANAAIQVLYWHAKAADATGTTYELEVAKNARVEVKDNKCKCTHARGVDLDTEGEGITLYHMAKNQELPCRTAGSKHFAKVPKTDITTYNDNLLTQAIAEEESRGTQKEKIQHLVTMTDADFAKLLGYTDAQYAALADLTQALDRIYHFTAVVTHHYAARARKRDPGGYFDWDKFLGHAYLADMRESAPFQWDPSVATRSPKGYAERAHAGKWG